MPNMFQRFQCGCEYAGCEDYDYDCVGKQHFFMSVGFAFDFNTKF